MTVIYAAALKTARMNEVLAAIDAGAGAGKLEIGTSGMALVLATITLADPAGSVTGDALTLTMPQSDLSADAGGIAAEARIRDSNNNNVVTELTVGTAGTDIVLDNDNIAAAQQVTINSAIMTHG